MLETPRRRPMDPYAGAVRLLVCLTEDGYLEWLESVAAVLDAVAGISTPETHVVVRAGSLVEKSNFLDEAWTSPVKDRAAVLSSQHGVGAIYLEGLPIRAVAAFERPLRRRAELVGIVDVTHEPRTSLMLKNALPLQYRVVGREARVLHEHISLVGDPEYLEERRQWVEELGIFDRVVPEDVGLRDTIFDASTEDPHRVVRVSEIVALATNVDHAEAAVLWLDVQDFHLTDALHAATKTCLSASYGEEAAQGAVSCRRFLQQLADVLFPARSAPYKGRDVGKKDWLNRLSAAIENALATGAVDELNRLGRLTHEIKVAAEDGVHAVPPITPERAVELVERLLEWVYELSLLLPPPERSSLVPYEAHALGMFREMLADDC